MRLELSCMSVVAVVVCDLLIGYAHADLQQLRVYLQVVCPYWSSPDIALPVPNVCSEYLHVGLATHSLISETFV